MGDERLVFTNERGESITLLDGEPYLLQSILGMGAGDVNISTTKAPFQDGSTLLEKTMDEKTMALSFAILATSAEDLYAKRRTVTQVFNPKIGMGSLKYIYPGGVKAIPCTVDEAPTFPMQSGDYAETYQRVVVSLMSPIPFWNDEAPIAHELVAFDGLFEFPIEFPTQMGLEGDFIELDNIGDVETPVKLIVYGEIEEPTLTNATTGEYITLETTIQAGDYVEIDTSFGNKKVEHVDSVGVRTNIFHLIDIDSTFWKLDVGINRLEYSAISAGSGAAVYIEHDRRYIGI